ncbi:MAG: DUF4364 family protein [Clostridiaceae bacterium]|nr:DUF4364 family protein [Clostridiaceae bacterium]
MYFDDVQIRLIILYTLKSFKTTMSEENFQDVLVFSGILDYFTLMDFVLDMEKMGLINSVTVDGKKCYDITNKGEELVALFNDRIPLTVREDIFDTGEQTLKNINREHEIVTDIVAVDVRKFLAKCGIYEMGTPLLELNIFAGSRENAEEIVNRFKKDAAALYKTILEQIVEG